MIRSSTLPILPCSQGRTLWIVAFARADRAGNLINAVLVVVEICSGTNGLTLLNISSVQESWNFEPISALVIFCAPVILTFAMEPSPRQSIVALQSVAEPAAVIAFVTPSGIAPLHGELQNIRNIRNRLFDQCFICFACFGLVGCCGEIPTPLIL
jgi:hypothetical protein